MYQSDQLNVFKSSAQDGELLDVAGLNEITVLVDRSRTALTEVGINVWHNGMEGPPHYHDAKEQIFYILDGTATIFIGTDSFRVSPRDLVYVPRGVMHRTMVDPGITLSYLLFNAFSDADKEGHGSFADHIAKVKHTRRQQADEAAVGSEIDWTRSNLQGIFVPGQIMKTAANEEPLGVTPLVDWKKTDRCAAYFFDQRANTSCEILSEDGENAESTIYIIEGSGVFTIDDEHWPAAPSDIFYIPRNKAIVSKARNNGLTFLCLNTIL